jgi:tetratricopeptide (TPR) repeat protein
MSATVNQVHFSISEAIQIGRRYHAAGQLQQAEQIYRQVLQVEPANADALHLLGVVAHQVGKHAEGVELIERSLAIDARDPMAYNNLGAAQQSAGDFGGAVESYRRAISLLPDYADAYSNMAAALLRMGRYAEAAEQCRLALSLKPEFYPALSNLGAALRGMNQYEEANEALDKAVRLAPDLADVWRQLAAVQQSLGRLDDAERSFQKLLSIQPSDEVVLCGYASLLRQQLRFDHALAVYNRVLSLNSANVDALIGKGGALREIHKYSAALKVVQSVVESDPNHVSALQNLALVYRDLGRYDESIEVCERALKLETGLAETYNMLAGVRQEQGDITAAIRDSHAAIAADPNFAAAYGNLANMKRYSPQDEEEVRWFRERLESGEVAPQSIYHLHFALGKILDDLGRYDEAFAEFQMANTLAGGPCDAAVFRKRFDRLRDVFTPELFRSLDGLGSDSQRPVFVIGMPRSGTTLVEQILSCHADVCGAGELPYINIYSQYIAYRLGDTENYPACMERLPRQLADDVVAKYLAELDQFSTDARRVTDKMPINFEHLGLIAVLFPRARVIHCRRHPLDVCLSCYFANFAGRISYAYDFRNLGEFYRSYEQLMDHWREVLPIEMLEVDYTRLVDSPESTIRGLVEYCGLDWDPECLAFHKSKRAVRTASNVQVREPIHRRSIDRWKNYEKHLGPLRDSLGMA